MKDNQPIEAIFEKLKALPANNNPITNKILLLSTPRSGSSLFCDIITKNFTGQVAEWLNPRYFLAYNHVIHGKNDMNINLNEYLKFVTERIKSDEGAIIFHVHIEDAKKLLQNGLNILDIGFDHVFYIKRNDKIAQAVSLLRAKLTNAWTHNTTANKFNEEDFNIANVSKMLAELLNDDHIFQNQLAKITTREFVYETFISDNNQSYIDFFKETNLPTPSIFSTDMRVQSDEKSTELVNRFKSLLNI